MKESFACLLFACLLVCAGVASAGTTYYIDFSSGADTNNGTAKTTPWKHAPGMHNCASNCAAHTPAAGDEFIFEGGVTWNYTIFPWDMTGGGSSSSSTYGCDNGAGGGGCVYYGVDQTWFTGGSWTRPILNAGGWSNSPTDTTCFYNNDPSANNYIATEGTSFFIFDNFEFTGACSQTGSPNHNGGGQAGVFATNGGGGDGDHYQFENLYFHGWVFPAVTPCPTCTTSPPPPSGDYFKVFISSSGPIHARYGPYNVIDGSDATGASNGQNWYSGEAVYGSPGEVDHDVFVNVPQSLDTNHSIFRLHDNLFLNGDAYSISSGASGAGVHEHLDNSQSDCQNNQETWYDNVAINVQAGEGWNTQTSNGCTLFEFNNILIDDEMGFNGNGATVNAFFITDTGGGGSTAQVFNNFCEAGLDNNTFFGGCYRKGVTTLGFINNYTISTVSARGEIDGTADVYTTNLIQTLTTANAAGLNCNLSGIYTCTGQTYSFSPVSGTSTTVGAGTNETALCNTITDATAQAACKLDTTYAVSYNATNHTAVASTRTPVARPSSGAWDVGAYEYSASGLPAVSFSPTSIAFGNQYVATGSGTLTINASGGITLTGTNPSDFAITGGTCANSGTVAAGGNCTIIVDFTPAAVASYSASVSVADNATGSPQTVPLTGVGTSLTAPAPAFAMKIKVSGEKTSSYSKGTLSCQCDAACSAAISYSALP